MLNLLRFAKSASGEGKVRARTRTRPTATRCATSWRAAASSCYGAGARDQVIIGDDEGDAWDMVLLVEYPSRKVFLEMGASKDYEKVGEHRTNALVDSRLVACTEQFRIRA